MTVAELIEKLKALPQDAVVVAWEGELEYWFQVDEVSPPGDWLRRTHGPLPDNCVVIA